MSTEAATQLVAPEHSADVPLRVNIGRVLCIVVPLIVWFAPLNMAAPAKHGLAITWFMIGAWITGAKEFARAGLIGCYLVWALGVVGFGVAFRGFASDSTWFLFGAIVCGTMAAKSG